MKLTYKNGVLITLDKLDTIYKVTVCNNVLNDQKPNIIDDFVTKNQIEAENAYHRKISAWIEGQKD